MKTRAIFTALLLSGLFTLQAPLHAKPNAKKTKFRTWQKEVAHYLYNVVLPSKLNDGQVIIHFTVDQAHTIQNLKVYSDNALVQKEFKERLLGKSLNSLNSLNNQAELVDGGYLLKVHLKVN